MIVLVISIFAVALVSRRLEGSIITPPMILVTIGLLVGPLALDLVDFESNIEVISIFAEVALAITLLGDAAGVDIGILKSNKMPTRLLVIGLPLTIALGALAAALIFKNIVLAEAGLIGAVLAPTDASLGQAIVQNIRIPVKIRQALDVESGLNDGGAVPFFALFLIIARAEAENLPLSSWLVFAVEQIGLGIVVGVIAGLLGSWMFNKAIKKGWMDRRFQSIALIALALAAYFISSEVGGSGFITAYIAGLMIAINKRNVPEESIKYVGTEGEVLGLGVFFILGLTMASIFPEIDLMVVFYAILSLTAIRMIPVAASLLGTHQSKRTVLFMGWFGPRGLASIVLMLIALESAPDIPNIKIIAGAVFLTVLISIFAHGLTAVPAIDRLYGEGEEKPRNV